MIEQIVAINNDCKEVRAGGSSREATDILCYLSETLTIDGVGICLYIALIFSSK